jgi:putative acetyltransferase
LEQPVEIKIDDLNGTAIAEFLAEHIREMQAISPPESKHALDLEGLRKPDITFWTVWDNQALAGCGAVKELDARHAEIKSMRTSSLYKQRGVASMLLRHMIGEAKNRGYARLSLETGSMAFFEPARKLYGKFGFEYCAPFSNYVEDPNSVFMTKAF